MKQNLFTLLFVGFAWSSVAHAAGDISAGESKAGVCAGCHGPAGVSSNPAWPKLAGQHESYIAAQLADMKSGKKRSDATMGPMAAPLSEQDMLDLGAYFSAQNVSTGQATSQELADAGGRLYRGGNAESMVPACMACHGPNGLGNREAGFPLLAGQHATYTAKALSDFASGVRSNDAAGMMRDIAQRMSKAEVKAVSEFIAGLH
ncbi:MAG TPA: cytochrome c4 [Chromatiaceae bacterium]|jgi:cytochrome c553|nr:cytochrome c4 [Chromatiaceae bacterium]HIB84569.1 cytochrome c4 [Chromatiaceae bacterium]HIN82131.1 cytochrome c4 [Chromatiales bacterium]HIO14383.1 cytochrome c4 [Chromatiales bacterium]HIO53855.1 cytochrome c4 [Chromatiales bacterium]